MTQSPTRAPAQEVDPNGHAQWHPEHARTSCSDSSIVNADPEGSTGCARCTALLLDQRKMLLAALREIERVAPSHIGHIASTAIAKATP